MIPAASAMSKRKAARSSRWLILKKMFCRCVFMRKLFFSCVKFSCYRSRLVSTGSDYRCIGNVPADRRAQLPLAHTLNFFLPVCFFCEKWSESAETVFFVLSALFGFFFFSKSFEMGRAPQDEENEPNPEAVAFLVTE